MQRSARLRDGGNFFLEQSPDENSRQDGGERRRENGFHVRSLRFAPSARCKATSAPGVSAVLSRSHERGGFSLQ
jgi:hypothetical protein